MDSQCHISPLQKHFDFKLQKLNFLKVVSHWQGSCWQGQHQKNGWLAKVFQMLISTWFLNVDLIILANVDLNQENMTHFEQKRQLG